MPRKLKILFLVKQFGERLAKHKAKFDFIKAIEKQAEVYYWDKDGNILDILQQINFNPDFIYHYDIAWNYAFAPKIAGLGSVNIPKGCFIYDAHYNKSIRTDYINQNKIDLIFSATKYAFLRTFPEYKRKFRWLPWSINPDIIKDWNVKKDIDYLLMGKVYHDTLNRTGTPKGRYPFRDAVLSKMAAEKGFIYHPHPGNKVAPSKNLLVDKNYAKELNRSKMFFTCGSVRNYGVLKFFEAPGCRTLLLAEPNKDILELGFKHGVNFIACNNSDFYKKAKYYLKNEKERNRITNNGYMFIQRYHTNEVRAKEFINHITKFIKTNKQ
ncbi:glycosyltransferase [Alteribacillus sp. JSM 102045]|uniref:glycosyltransferase n=1 Tax=Alteribacillus sp. JSM 102045 TaxID=1562101 RepID=UPI0035C0631C